MTVQQWLESGQDYEVGRQLYAALGANERLKRTLSSGPGRYNQEALAWELTKLHRAGVGAIVTINVPANVTTAPADMPKKVQKEVQKEPGQNGECGPNATISWQKKPGSEPEGNRLLDELKAARRPLYDERTISWQKKPGSEPEGNRLLDELKAARRPLYDERTVLHAQLEALATDAERHAHARRMMALSRELNANWQLDGYVRAHGCLPPPPPAPPGLDALPPAELLQRRNNLRSQASKLKKQPHRADDLVLVEAELKQVEVLLNPAK